jgi:hypothetical protein
LRHARRRGWVRAFNKIIELTEQAGLPTPEFESYTGEFLIRFRPGKAALKTRQVGGGRVNGTANPPPVERKRVFKIRNSEYIGTKYNYRFSPQDDEQTHQG